MTDKSGDSAATDFAGDLAALRTDIANLSETIAELMSGRANATGAAADLERRIERDPLTAVLIAAGIGMAIGMMTKSRR